MRIRDYVPALLASIGLTLVVAPLRALLDLSNVALLYVLVVVLSGARYGRGPALLAALAGSLLYAYVFVPPHFSLAITEIQYLLSALILFVVALLVGHLTASLKGRAEEIQAKEKHSRALYDLARRLTATLTHEEVEETAGRFLGEVLQATEARLIAEADFPHPPRPASPAILHAAVERGEPLVVPDPARKLTMVLLPLQGSAGSRIVLGFEITPSVACLESTWGLLKTVASVVAVALERAHFAQVARETEVRMSAEALRNSILSALSHDLRTPLTALVGMADTLTLGKATPERQQAMLHALRGQALAISQQVTNLLDMARLRSGAIELNEAWQPVEEVVGATVQLVKSQWSDREINVDIPMGLPPLRFDAVLIERVLWNLLENAIKYSPAEMPVDIVVRPAGDQVDVMVCDRGPGLPPGGVDELFGLFRRGQVESTIPGVGLGLAIARTIAEAHGGQILADSRPGGGACFRLRLPVGSPPSLEDLEETA
ncbi:MAG TPA: ATP-binding protein [Rhodocyclaceae bacterium]|nr:ATP-binding protein [Rhodocyclaceae bacterium]